MGYPNGGSPLICHYCKKRTDQGHLMPEDKTGYRNWVCGNCVADPKLKLRLAMDGLNLSLEYPFTTRDGRPYRVRRCDAITNKVVSNSESLKIHPYWYLRYPFFETDQPATRASIDSALRKAGPGITWYVIRTRRGIHMISPNRIWHLTTFGSPSKGRADSDSLMLVNMFREISKTVILDKDHWKVGANRSGNYLVLRTGQKYEHPDLKFWFKIKGDLPYDPVMDKLINILYGLSKDSIDDEPVNTLYQRLRLVIDNRVYASD